MTRMLIDHISSIGFRIMAQVLRHGKPKEDVEAANHNAPFDGKGVDFEQQPWGPDYAVCMSKEPIRPSESPQTARIGSNLHS